MTIEWPRIGEGIGLYSDVKPTKPTGYRIFETDTGDTLVSDGQFWWLCNYPGALSPRRFSRSSPGMSTVNGAEGVFVNMSAATGAGAGNLGYSVAGDTTNGTIFVMNSGTTIGNRGGNRQINTIAVRANNPKLKIPFKLQQVNANPPNQNFWLGFHTQNTELSGNDPLNAAGGIVFGINNTVNTNFAVMHNDITGATVIDDTGIPFDTAFHTLYLVADDANNKWWWRLDNRAYVAVTADIPGSTNVALGMMFEIETQESGVLKSFWQYKTTFQAEK